MGRFKNFLNKLETWHSSIGLLINFVVALVVIAGFIWTVTWTVYWARAQKTKSNDRLTIFQSEVKQLAKDYDRITSEKVSAASAEAKDYAERNDKVVLAETVRRIIASHGNDDRAIGDGYKKAIEAALTACYIYEANFTPDEFGSNFFMTQLDYRPGPVGMKGSSHLLTIREKNNINLCIKSYLEELKSAKPNKELRDRAVQQEACWFLLQHKESTIGSVTEPLDLQVDRPTSSGKKIEVMDSYSKVGAIVGYIGDELSRRAGGF